MERYQTDATTFCKRQQGQQRRPPSPKWWCSNKQQFNLWNSATRKFDLFPSRMMPEGRNPHLDSKNKVKTLPFVIWSVILYLWTCMNDAQPFLSAWVFFQCLRGPFSRPLWARFRLCVWAAVANAAWRHGFAFIPSLHSADTGWMDIEVGPVNWCWCGTGVSNRAINKHSHWFNSDECFAIICWRDAKKCIRRHFFHIVISETSLISSSYRNTWCQNLLQRTGLIL